MQQLHEIFKFYNSVKTGFSLLDLMNQLEEVLGQIWGKPPLYFYNLIDHTFKHIAGEKVKNPEIFSEQFNTEFENIVVEKKNDDYILLFNKMNVSKNEQGILFTILNKEHNEQQSEIIRKYMELSAFIVKEGFSYALKKSNQRNEVIIDIQKKMMNAESVPYLCEELILYLKNRYPDFDIHILLPDKEQFFDFYLVNGVFQKSSISEAEFETILAKDEIYFVNRNRVMFQCRDENRGIGAISITSPYQNFLTPELKVFFSILSNLLVLAHERIMYDQKLRQESELLKELIGFRKDITAMIAHDLSSPLMGIMGYMSILKNLPEKMPTMVIDYLNKSYRLTLRLNKLIEDFRMITQIDDNRLKLNLDKTPVNIFFREIFKFFKDLYPVEISFENSDNIEFITVDPHYFSRVVENIISNTIKYAGENAIIKVLVRRLDDKHIQLEMSDNGPGIPEEDLPHIFEKYKRSKTGRSVYGTGLGLYICKVVTDMHNGSIHVQNGEDQGVRFLITLPLK